ncbi:MAG TPA: hypothetical protein VGM18_11000 [Candidatus Sulfotelmatobacter sp.]|jgi:hypothetical protein
MKKSVLKKPILGTLRGEIQIIDPDWWKPMSDKEVDEFLGDDDFDVPRRVKPAEKRIDKPQR